MSTPMASDLLKFIFKFESAPQSSNSQRRFGSDTAGSIKEKSKLSTYADILYWVPPYSGHPCLILFVMGKGLESILLALT